MSKSASKVNVQSPPVEELEDCVKPEFIYGGPFIAQPKEEPFINAATPINVCLQGTFKRSFAFYSLKERLPIILTKVIDLLSRDAAKVKSSTGASDEEVRKAVQYIAQLKNELVTNKKFELLKIDTPEAKKWNTWIEAASPPTYFNNIWVFSECYVYRRLREAFEASPKLASFDPFAEQKNESFNNNVESMCIVAAKLPEMFEKGDKDKRKADFITLLKLSLWANKCDLSLSLCAIAEMAADPFKMITDYKDKLLVDDSGKIADQVVTKAEDKAKLIEEPPEPKASKTAQSPPAEAAEEEEKPEIPCPAKMVIPSTLFFDIICDNAGYELFADLCLAQFLIEQEIVKKVRFHVKSIPWFVSDVTPRDFRYVINSCAGAQYRKEIPAPPKPEPAEGEAAAEADPPTVISSEGLQSLGQQWNRFVEDGTFILMENHFWTSPHVFRDMKKYEPNLYRTLQFAVAALFKGDLNYRKLLCDKNCNPVAGFEPSLQGFIPTPIIALRTVKADLICGLPKGKKEQITKIDEMWMRKGDYGVIQFCAKAEPFKVSDRPCLDFPGPCTGNVCPVHADL